MDAERESLRFYYLGNKYENKIEHFGTKSGYDPEVCLCFDYLPRTLSGQKKSGCSRNYMRTKHAFFKDC